MNSEFTLSNSSRKKKKRKERKKFIERKSNNHPLLSPVSFSRFWKSSSYFNASSRVDETTSIAYAIRVREQNHEEHKYPRQVSRGIITRVSTHTRQRERGTNESRGRTCVTDVLELEYTKETRSPAPLRNPVGVYTAAKLQCPATHNAATVLARVIMLVLTARLRSRRWNYRC